VSGVQQPGGLVSLRCDRCHNRSRGEAATWTAAFRRRRRSHRGREPGSRRRLRLRRRQRRASMRRTSRSSASPGRSARHVMGPWGSAPMPALSWRAPGTIGKPVRVAKPRPAARGLEPQLELPARRYWRPGELEPATHSLETDALSGYGARSQAWELALRQVPGQPPLRARGGHPRPRGILTGVSPPPDRLLERGSRSDRACSSTST
jgi:hypothetical protein